MYVVYTSLQATYACDGGPIQTFGPAYEKKTIGYSSRFLAYGTLSSPNQRCNENVVVGGFHTIDFSDLYYHPITTSVTSKAGCPPYINPRLSLPAELTDVDAAWKTCQPLHYGAFDPPRVLTKVDGPVSPPPTTDIPKPVPASAPDPIVTSSQDIRSTSIPAIQGPSAPATPSPTSNVVSTVPAANPDVVEGESLPTGLGGPIIFGLSGPTASESTVSRDEENAEGWGIFGLSRPTTSDRSTVSRDEENAQGSRTADGISPGPVVSNPANLEMSPPHAIGTQAAVTAPQETLVQGQTTSPGGQATDENVVDFLDTASEDEENVEESPTADETFSGPAVPNPAVLETTTPLEIGTEAVVTAPHEMFVQGQTTSPGSQVTDDNAAGFLETTKPGPEHTLAAGAVTTIGGVPITNTGPSAVVFPTATAVDNPADLLDTSKLVPEHTLAAGAVTTIGGVPITNTGPSAVVFPTATVVENAANLLDTSKLVKGERTEAFAYETAPTAESTLFTLIIEEETLAAGAVKRIGGFPITNTGPSAVIFPDVTVVAISMAAATSPSVEDTRHDSGNVVYSILAAPDSLQADEITTKDTHVSINPAESAVGISLLSDISSDTMDEPSTEGLNRLYAPSIVTRSIAPGSIFMVSGSRTTNMASSAQLLTEVIPVPIATYTPSIVTRSIEPGSVFTVSDTPTTNTASSALLLTQEIMPIATYAPSLVTRSIEPGSVFTISGSLTTNTASSALLLTKEIHVPAPSIVTKTISPGSVFTVSGSLTTNTASSALLLLEDIHVPAPSIATKTISPGSVFTVSGSLTTNTASSALLLLEDIHVPAPSIATKTISPGSVFTVSGSLTTNTASSALLLTEEIHFPIPTNLFPTKTSLLGHISNANGQSASQTMGIDLTETGTANQNQAGLVTLHLLEEENGSTVTRAMTMPAILPSQLSLNTASSDSGKGGMANSSTATTSTTEPQTAPAQGTSTQSQSLNNGAGKSRAKCGLAISLMSIAGFLCVFIL